MATLRTLFLNPPSYAGFDGGAGSRYQACREIKSFWFPTWLAQPAALIANSKIIDAPADDLGLEQVLQMAKGFDLCVIHTSTPSFDNDAHVAAELKRAYPEMLVGFVGAHVAVLPDISLRAAPALDFVAREEFDYTLLEIAQGKPLADVAGISYRCDGELRRNPDRELIKDMDSLPSVLDVYRRDLTIENYYIGYLLHPYVSLYTGRGCPARCTFCLWPQTVGGRTYRARSAASVIAEMARAKELFPQVKEFFFDDDTFTADLPRAAEIARGMGRLGLTWSCNARANVPYEYLKLFKENGLRLLLVGYESGNQQILNNVKKGLRLDVAEEFTRNCRKLGILIHGTFVLGLPGETQETINESLRFACRIDIDTIQVSLAAPYPGTELYQQAMANKWYEPASLVRNDGTQSCALSYPNLSAAAIQAGVKRFYSRFYARPTPILRMLLRMARDPLERRRRIREGREFLRYLSGRTASSQARCSCQELRKSGPSVTAGRD
ncbi:MAG TPA: hopanoid biosynthesis associated radical SAM protein HpnJ [Elusimicrobia bacterium]|nr:hopanoid biosynthesis associated radical SAM protein HpnJ [Elusimicrobiota bacterium]HBT62747.1 hopanoid biosynthesis associated radical SAM protein HpnJ [Elusimicrobiota bacterium]